MQVPTKYVTRAGLAFVLLGAAVHLLLGGSQIPLVRNLLFLGIGVGFVGAIIYIVAGKEFDP
jgi:hypothetical protein